MTLALVKSGPAVSPGQLRGVGTQDVPFAWQEVGPWVDRAATRSRGKYTGADILAALLDARAQLWVWSTPTAFGVLVTQIEQYPRNKCCWIRVATGSNAAEWAQAAVARIEQFAREVGCDAMELIARPGWEKFLPSYARTHVYLEKAL